MGTNSTDIISGHYALHLGLLSAACQLISDVAPYIRIEFDRAATRECRERENRQLGFFGALRNANLSHKRALTFQSYDTKTKGQLLRAALIAIASILFVIWNR